MKYRDEVYTLEYFINKFSDIPEDYIGLSSEGTDAYEWCDQDEGNALYMIVRLWGYLTDINDGINSSKFFGRTPKGKDHQFS